MVSGIDHQLRPGLRLRGTDPEALGNTGQANFRQSRTPSTAPRHGAESGPDNRRTGDETMPIVMYQKMPPEATIEMIEAVTNEMDVRTLPPNGLIVHTAVDMGGRLTIIDVWESQDDFEEFSKARLGPAFAAVAERMGIDMSQAAEPETQILEVLSIVHGDAG